MALLRWLKALSDDTRLRLLHLLSRYELSVGEVVQVLGMSQPRVSRHLKILADAGLVQVRRDGLWAFYSATSHGQGAEFLSCMGPWLGQAAGAAQDMDAAEAVMAARRSETKRFFNRVAPNWEAMRGELLSGFDLSAAILDLLPRNAGPSGDLGCGTGGMLPEIASRAGTAIGVDNSQSMLDIARARFAAESAIELRMGELEHLPLRDGELASAVMNLSLHHLSRPEQAVVEAARVLADGGVLVIADFGRHDREELRQRYGDRWLGFDEDDLRAWIAQAGLHLESLNAQRLESGLTLLLAVARKR
ncbi:MAG: metalloregulator ArsR/SmtB family transcription factor [Desulfocurvibacter africanus]